MNVSEYLYVSECLRVYDIVSANASYNVAITQLHVSGNFESVYTKTR